MDNPQDGDVAEDEENLPRKDQQRCPVFEKNGCILTLQEGAGHPQDHPRRKNSPGGKRRKGKYWEVSKNLLHCLTFDTAAAELDSGDM